MHVTARWAAVGVAAVMVLTGCAGGDQPTAADEAQGVSDDAAGSDVDSDDAGEADDAPVEEPAGDEEVGQEAGAGTATVQVDGQTFTFRVIQCLRDVPGFMGGTVAFQLDGVPPDTAPELVEPLLGPIDPDADIRQRLAPVLEGGPVLSVSRVTDGGDMVALSTSLDAAYVTTPDVTSDAARYLDISDAASGASVVGTAEATTPQGTSAQLSVDAVCP